MRAFIKSPDASRRPSSRSPSIIVPNVHSRTSTPNRLGDLSAPRPFER